MGPPFSTATVKVTYKSTRGSHTEGSICTDPKHFFEILLDEDFDRFKAMYDRSPAEAKQAIDAVFEGEVFEDSCDAGLWLNTKSADFLAAKYGEIQKILDPPPVPAV